MAFDFPASPAQDQVFTPPGGPTYIFKGPAWKVATPANSNYVLKAGDTMTGDLTIAKDIPTLNLNRTTATLAAIYAQRNGLNRWGWVFNGAAESGGNVGSDLELRAFNDAGAYNYSALVINRQTGGVGLGKGQLAFPATANLSSDPNTLDAYAEGIWVPGFSFGGVSTGITYNVQAGRYVRIGNLVLAKCDVRMSNKGAAAGNLQITGYPFASANDGVQAVSGIAYSWNFTGVTGMLLANMVLNGTVASIIGGPATAVVPVTNANCLDTASMVVTMMYTTI